ncbi:hypothetical protein [Streptomyces sp. NPDC003247]|uniref:hypothetical protein n=1 Tax=Streptomyces sp. NPDC003247 TaxID=3364677 RepID=UPI0036927A05
MTTRGALVLLLAVLSGGVAAALSWTGGEGPSRSVLAGLAAAGLAASFFDRLIVNDGARGGASHESEGEGRG